MVSSIDSIKQIGESNPSGNTTIRIIDIDEARLIPPRTLGFNAAALADPLSPEYLEHINALHKQLKTETPKHFRPEASSGSLKINSLFKKASDECKNCAEVASRPMPQRSFKKSFKSSMRTQMLSSFLTQSKMSADPFIVSPINEDLESEEAAADDLLAYSKSNEMKNRRKRPKP